ncbi:hypothetical protein MYX76_15020 [Desulfobacterota bacterium AH_259_B03_O07]|nr:hypothetical protein [Desulfobacterota bacterium AH_259_B03_O07]
MRSLHGGCAELSRSIHIDAAVGAASSREKSQQDAAPTSEIYPAAIPISRQGWRSYKC